MSFEERLDAVAMNLELASREIVDLSREVRDLGEQVRDLGKLVQQDGENIRALARIAEIHEHRISGLEGSNT